MPVDKGYSAEFEVSDEYRVEHDSLYQQADEFCEQVTINSVK